MYSFIWGPVMKVIIHENNKGTTTIRVAADNFYVPNAGPSSANDFICFLRPEDAPDGYRKATIEEIATRDVPLRIIGNKEDGSPIYGEQFPFKIIDRESVPEDGPFRSALKYDLSIDMPKARKIHMDRIRLSRDKRLTELDKRKYGSEFDAERQRLRDLPQTLDLSTATTPEELKALWPQELEN
jgi:hypothetical protein